MDDAIFIILLKKHVKYVIWHLTIWWSTFPKSRLVYMGTLEQKFIGFDSQNLHDQIQLIQQFVYLKELI